MKCSKCNGEIEGCYECEDDIIIGEDIYCVGGYHHLHVSCFDMPALARVTE